MPETPRYEGQLTILVTTARGSIPIPDATVRITGTHTEEQVRFTDRDGRTDTITLPAPPPENSESASLSDPFFDYRVSVYKPGFYRHVVENVPIFPGVVSFQSVDLIGLSEAAPDLSAPKDSTTTVPDDPQVLNKMPVPPKTTQGQESEE